MHLHLPRVRTILAALSLLWLLLGPAGACAALAASPTRYKVLHIMSYHSPWEWTDDQLNAFKEALKGLDVEYKVFQMDTKRQSTDASKEKAGAEARTLIESWKPDLVYTTDDNAQQLVTRHYVNRSIPFVFGAVNADPKDYGFVGSRNITGVLEQEHAVETVKLLRDVVPTVTRIGVIVDDDPTWDGVVGRMKDRMAMHLPEVKVVGWNVVRTYREYQDTVKRYQNGADALGLLGIHTFKDEQGKNVPWQDVLKWTVDHSRLPDFSFWKDRVPYGTLCAVYVSAREQGLAAGRIARGILVEGKAPSSFAMEPTRKGEPILSLARARRLGIRPTSTTLLTARVVEKFTWDEPKP